MNRRKPTICLLALAAPALLAGCLKINTRIKLDPDGTATITERLYFSERLLDLAAEAGNDLKIARHLTRQAVEKRVKQMGEKVRLVSHKTTTLDNGARESVTVMKVQDPNDFRYISPFPAYADFADNSVVQCRMVPLYKSRNYVGTAGEMAVSFRPVHRPKRHPRPDKDKPPPKGPAPRQVQMLRYLQPVFADMLKGFQLRFTFETYCPIAVSGLGLRGRRAGVNHTDLIHFSDRDLDQYGQEFLKNEEIVLDLLRGQVGSSDIVAAVRQFAGNRTVPVFVPAGSAHDYWRGGDEICFAPSRQLFDKHFAGKKLDYSRWATSSPDKIKPARFQDIGYQPPKRSNTEKPNQPGSG